MLRFIAFLPILLFEALITFGVAGFMQLLNDVMIFDTAQYLAIGQDVVINKEYWISSAWYNTLHTGIVAIILGGLVFLFNRFIFKKMDLQSFSLYALMSAVIVTTVIHYFGLYATFLMLERSYPRW